MSASKRRLKKEIAQRRAYLAEHGILTGDDAVRFIEAAENPRPIPPEEILRMKGSYTNIMDMSPILKTITEEQVRAMLNECEEWIENMTDGRIMVSFQSIAKKYGINIPNRLAQ